MRLCIAVLLCACVSAPASPQLATAEQLHARAVSAFRQGRFPEAYGRFVSLADAGHGPSARAALWMCEHGSSLFGHAWDCAPHQIDDWAHAAGVKAPKIGPQVEVRVVPGVRTSGATGTSR